MDFSPMEMREMWYIYDVKIGHVSSSVHAYFDARNLSICVRTYVHVCGSRHYLLTMHSMPCCSLDEVHSCCDVTPLVPSSHLQSAVHPVIRMSYRIILGMPEIIQWLHFREVTHSYVRTVRSQMFFSTKFKPSSPFPPSLSPNSCETSLFLP